MALPVPDVSVCIITYRHERYLAECLQSVLCQETDFPFEIVVGEDCSPDRTRDILQRFANQHPDRIVLRLPEANEGMGQNFRKTYGICRGRYIALLEGDDVWTEPTKLQQQKLALDAHNRWSGCFHAVPQIDESGRPLGHPHPPQFQSEWTFADLCRGNPIRTCSVMLRRTAFEQVPAWMEPLPMLDWPMFLHCALDGPLGMLPGEMAAYRVHAQGVWSSRTQADCWRASLTTLEKVRRHLPVERLPEFDAERAAWLSEATIHLAEQIDVLRMTWPQRLRERARSWKRRLKRLITRNG